MLDGQPDLEKGRNRNNEFYGVSSLNMKLQALNGRYEFPKTTDNADYEAEIEAGYEGAVTRIYVDDYFNVYTPVDKYEYGDIVEWSSNEPKGIQSFCLLLF